jgi:phosphoadenosine phosphosulfate reductase
LVPYPRFESWSATLILAWAFDRYGESIALGTSFQKEGMVVLDTAWRLNPSLRVFTLDTGCLPQETLDMIATVRERYGITVERVRPDEAEVAAMVAAHGADLYYREVVLRALCCQVRKVRPLERKLAGFEAWITGLRRGQNSTRSEVPKVETGGATVKINPVADWTAADIDAYTRVHGVPVHPLYARGFTSIGCAPCTRAVAPGEDARAGRWWWEREAPKECGIHFTAAGHAERRVDVPLAEVLGGKGA